MSFFISQELDTGWKVDPEVLLPKLVQRWPDAVVRRIFDFTRGYSHEWTLALPGGRLDCMIEREQKGIVLEGSIESAAEFAEWFKSESSPEDYSLSFYDLAYETVVRLAKNTQASDVAAQCAKGSKGPDL